MHTGFSNNSELGVLPCTTLDTTITTVSDVLRGGAGYWNKIRVDFPEVFASRAKLERDIGHSMSKRYFLDELPPDKGRMTDEVMEDCSILCQLAVGEWAWDMEGK